jgi:RimJ/RimL family protein N-acetyltransferase
MHDEGRIIDVAEARRTRLTARLRLQPIGPQHAEHLDRLLRDPVVAHWYGGSWDHAQAEAYAQSSERAWVQDGIHKWMAFDRANGDLVGRGGLSRLPVGASETEQIAKLMAGNDWDQSRLEVGWALLSERHGHGYATELGQEALVVARDLLRARTVVAFTELINRASRAVMERLGMTYVGEIRGIGLAEGQEEVSDDAPFAVYATVEPSGANWGGS